MNIFRDAIDKRAEAAISFNPAVQTGYVLSTADVIDSELKNPFFYSLNHMSALDAVLLRQDEIKSGWSVSLRDSTGTRQEKVFTNPKFTDTRLFGDATGKVAGVLQGRQIVMADVIFSGTNNQLPTVVGIQSLDTNISSNTSASPQETGANTSIPDKRAKPGDADFIGPIDKLPKMIDEKGKTFTPTEDITERNLYGHSIRTGSVKTSTTSVREFLHYSASTSFIVR